MHNTNVKSIFGFEGVCVGGIADGRTYNHTKPEMTVTAMRRLPDGTTEPTNDTTEYVYLLLLGSVRGDIGVWVPAGTQADTVIITLINKYRMQPLGGKPTFQF